MEYEEEVLRSSFRSSGSSEQKESLSNTARTRPLDSNGIDGASTSMSKPAHSSSGVSGNGDSRLELSSNRLPMSTESLDSSSPLNTTSDRGANQDCEGTVRYRPPPGSCEFVVFHQVNQELCGGDSVITM